MGRRVLRERMLRPITRIDELNERLNTLEFLIHPQNLSLSDELQSCLQKIGDASKLLYRLKRQPRLPDWQAIFNVCCLNLL